jgi:tetratricopeptide (TPR) repeat protein
LRQAVRLAPNSDGSLMELARHLVTCPDKSRRNPTEAILYAKQAVDLNPNYYRYRMFLGVAQYEAGQWDEALDTLSKAAEMRSNRFDEFYYFVLAMAQWRTGNKQQAQKTFELTVRSCRGDRYGYRSEAEELLGIRTSTSNAEDASLDVGSQRKERTSRVPPTPDSN